MTKIFDVVCVDNVEYIIDKSEKGKEGFNINLALKKVEKLSRDYEPHSSEWNFCFKIIASTNTNLANLPSFKHFEQTPKQVILEIEDLFDETYGELNGIHLKIDSNGNVIIKSAIY